MTVGSTELVFALIPVIAVSTVEVESCCSGSSSRSSSSSTSSSGASSARPARIFVCRRKASSSTSTRPPRCASRPSCRPASWSSCAARPWSRASATAELRAGHDRPRHENDLPLGRGRVRLRAACSGGAATRRRVAQDIGSTNGTFLNGSQVSQPRRLTPGDVIRRDRSEVRTASLRTAHLTHLGPQAAPQRGLLRPRPAVVRDRGRDGHEGRRGRLRGSPSRRPCAPTSAVTRGTTSSS